MIKIFYLVAVNQINTSNSEKKMETHIYPLDFRFTGYTLLFILLSSGYFIDMSGCQIH